MKYQAVNLSHFRFVVNKGEEIKGKKWLKKNNTIFYRKLPICFLFLHENICCWYSLEAPRRGASNEYHNICFHGETRKLLCGYLH